jgi:hypothetical protein
VEQWQEIPIRIQTQDNRGNHTTVDFNKLGIEINRGESLHIQVLPPWTSNFEFSGNLTRSSKAYFITSATLIVRLVD